MQDSTKSSTIKLSQAIGKIIQKHRLEQNVTIYKVSAECSMNKESWRIIEKGFINDIRISSLWKMCEGLELNPVDVIKEVQEYLGDDFTVSGLTWKQ